MTLRRRLLLLTPFVGYMILVSPFINQLPMHEEVIHVRDAGSWQTALRYPWHPPLYILTVRLARSILGDTYQVMYLVGIVSAFINIYLVKLILDNILINKDSGVRLRYSLLGMWVFVLIPISVHGSILLEMEPTVLTPLCLLAIWYYTRHESALHTVRHRAILGLLFGLAMWAKYFITPFLLISAIFLYELSRGRPALTAIKHSAMVLTASVGFFVPTYLVYSYFLIPGSNSFAFLAIDKTQEGMPIFLSGKILIPVITKLMAFTFWLSPFFIIFLIYLAYGMFKKWGQYSSERFLLIAILMIVLFYLIAHPYPFAESKYFYPAFPLIAILTASLLQRSGIKFPPLLYLLMIPATAAFIFFVLGDPLYQTLYFYRNGLKNEISQYIAFYVGVNLIVFGAGYFILRYKIHGLSNAFCVTVLYLSVGASLSLFTNQALGQYQTKFQYGETGAAEVIAYVKSEIPAEGSVILPGDISYYSGIKFSKEGFSLTEIERMSSGWDWLVERKVNFLRLSPEYLRLLTEQYELIKQIGSYQIYKRKALGQAKNVM